MIKVIAIIAGGGLGAIARFGISSAIHKIFNTDFPFWTLSVNVLGAFSMGVLYCLFQQALQLPAELKVMALEGFLGAFTTFSSYSLETVNLLKAHAYLAGVSNFLLNNVLCFLAVAGGFWIMKRS